MRETQEETGVSVEITGLLGIYSDPGHIVAYSGGEVRQEFEIILTGRPVSGVPAANDEASQVGWFTPGELKDLDIHPTQWRQPTKRGLQSGRTSARFEWVATIHMPLDVSVKGMAFGEYHRVANGRKWTINLL